ncbi:MAG: dTMP kinase [Coriobacteriia bacterium]
MGGCLVSFEGGEGCGKSTQLARVASRLRAAGVECTCVREPGGTPLGDLVRRLLLDPAHEGIEATAELLLYEASRAELVAKVLRPALANGGVVLADRFADSSTAYQAAGRGLPLSQVLEFNAWATGGLTPDLTVLLDVDPRVGLKRATGAGADRLELEDIAFHERVRSGFLELAKAEQERFRVVDASADEGAVFEGVWAAVAPVLRSRGTAV